jgi:transcriptional regulator with XRE-family HTH domain
MPQAIDSQRVLENLRSITGLAKQQDLAMAAGVTPDKLSKWKRGKQRIHWDHIMAMAATLGVPVEALVEAPAAPAPAERPPKTGGDTGHAAPGKPPRLKVVPARKDLLGVRAAAAEIHRAQNRLHDAAMVLQAMLDAIPFLVQRLDPDGTVRATWYGRGFPSAVPEGEENRENGRLKWEAVTPPAGPMWRRAFEQIQRTKETVEFLVTRQVGKERRLRRCFLVRADGGYVALVFDVQSISASMRRKNMFVVPATRTSADSTPAGC